MKFTKREIERIFLCAHLVESHLAAEKVINEIVFHKISNTLEPMGAELVCRALGLTKCHHMKEPIQTLTKNGPVYNCPECNTQMKPITFEPIELPELKDSP